MKATGIVRRIDAFGRVVIHTTMQMKMKKQKARCFHLAFYSLFDYYKIVFHSASLKPTRTAFSQITSGRLTNIPSVARSSSASSSLICGSLSLSPNDLYKSPLVLKNLFIGRPLFAYHSRSSCSDGLSTFMSLNS